MWLPNPPPLSFPSASPLSGHKDSIYSLAMNDAGSVLLSGSTDKVQPLLLSVVVLGVASLGCDQSRVWPVLGVTSPGCGQSWAWPVLGVASPGCGQSWVWPVLGVASLGCGQSWARPVLTWDSWMAGLVPSPVPVSFHSSSHTLKPHIHYITHLQATSFDHTPDTIPSPLVNT